MTADLRARLESSLSGSYAITREFGGGGMSRVFLATDKALDREVVVKVLSDETAAGVSGDRFRREIQVIARLQHPHVVPLLSAGSADGALYYVMPYRGGEPLRTRLSREGALPIAEIVRVLRNVLDALAFAHANGVIHRDIKPENILLESGHAVVADFGVSKALHESGGLTSVGVALGTPMYMAPEQASADPSTDHRADLYAVGIVAYEMLTGAPPFTGTPQQVLRAHMIEDPVAVSSKRADAPPALADLVMRALRKDPAARPASAGEMLAALELAITPSAGTQPYTAAGSALRERGRRNIVAFVILAILAAVAIPTLARQPWRPRVIASAQSIAIAPFSVASGDTALVRLGQNLVTTISAGMDGVGELRVADPMAVLNNARSRGALLAATDAMEIARKLGARSVLHGTLVPNGAMVRADAVLYESDGSGTVVARVSASAPRDSLTALSDSITWTLLREIWRGRAPTPNVASITTRNPQALRDFLEGERLFSRGYINEASEAYLRASRADTNFLYAQMRYQHARGWWLLPIDTAVSRRLRRNAHRLPDRDREWLTLWDSTPTITGRLTANRAFISRHPQYIWARVAYADYLLHHATRAGYDVREALPLWREIVQLVPADMDMAGHLMWACAMAGDLPCAREARVRYDSLTRADSAPSSQTTWTARTFMVLTEPNPSRLIDSLGRLSARGDTVPAFVSHLALTIFGPLAAAVPDLAGRWTRAMEAQRPAIERSSSPTAYRYMHAMARVVRGDWTALDSANALWSVAVLGPGVEQTRMESWRARLYGEALGMLQPSPRTAEMALALIDNPATSRGDRASARYMAGVNGLLRGDTALFRQQLAAASADSGFAAGVVARSLRAFGMGHAGNRASAAESLLVIERAHGEERTRRSPTAMGLNRILGAQWLTEAGRPAPADSLLRFTQGWAIAAHLEIASPLFTLAQLQRSRIAEALGNDADALQFAQVFLNIYDQAPAAQKPLLDEARARIARLGGTDTRRGR